MAQSPHFGLFLDPLLTYLFGVCCHLFLTLSSTTHPYLETTGHRDLLPGTPSVLCILGNFTPKTSNYCLKNRALGFPGRKESHVTKKNNEKWQQMAGERLQCLESPLREIPLPVFLARHVFSLYVAAFFSGRTPREGCRGWAAGKI